MKILFFIDRLYAGGRQRRVVELLKGLANKGYYLGIVAMRKHIHYQEIYNIKNLDIYIIERKYKKDLSIFFKFYKVAKLFQPDIIHVWSSMPALYSIPAKVFLNIKLINNQITDAPEKVERRIINFLLPSYFSNRIIANSRAGLDAYKVCTKKGMVIYNGFDSNRIKNLTNPLLLKEQLKINTKFIVGMVASFSKYKDYDTFFKAAKELLKQRNDITFIAIGQGDSFFYKKGIKREFPENIVILKEQADIESLMNICDIGVLTSFTEGLPNVIMEFMALGKPVIATDGGGTKELLIDGKSGFLIKKRDYKSLVKKIDFLINSFELRRRMGSFNESRIKSNFSIELMIDKFDKVYTDILS